MNRRTVTDQEGWTHVCSSRSKQKQKQASRNKRNRKKMYGPDGEIIVGQAPFKLEPAILESGITVEKLMKKYEAFSRQWDQTEFSTSIKRELTSIVGQMKWDTRDRYPAQTPTPENAYEQEQPEHDVKSKGKEVQHQVETKASHQPTKTLVQHQFHNAFCLASGSFSGVVGMDRTCEPSMWQLVAFLKMIEYLPASTKRNLSVYAQDPCFTPVDHDLLERLGITVLSDPEASEMLANPLSRTSDSITNDDAPPTTSSDTPANVSLIFAPFMDWVALTPLVIAHATTHSACVFDPSIGLVSPPPSKLPLFISCELEKTLQSAIDLQPYDIYQAQRAVTKTELVTVLLEYLGYESVAEYENEHDARQRGAQGKRKRGEEGTTPPRIRPWKTKFTAWPDFEKNESALHGLGFNWVPEREEED